MTNWLKQTINNINIISSILKIMFIIKEKNEK